MRGEVAELLRRTRQEKGFSLKDVEAAARVPLHYLQILEGEGNPRLLADLLYLVPFLRTYAGFLGLDPAVTIAQFVAATQQKDAIPQALSHSRFARWMTGAAVVVVIVIGVAALAFLWAGNDLRLLFGQ